ncbi:molybdopterin-binding protein [Oscillospiraceae bacterium WX1]
MKKMRVTEAVGQTLCHDLTGVDGKGEKSVVFRRGHIITEADIPRLLDIGKSRVNIWEADSSDVHEEEAALALAEAVCGGHMRFARTPTEGKVTLCAAAAGLFRVNTVAVKRLNSVGDYSVVCRPGDISAHVNETLCALRIVPLVTSRETVDKAVGIAREDYPVFSVIPFMPLLCGIIITGNEIYKGRIQDRMEPVVRKKLEAFGARVLNAVKCPDDAVAICRAINAFQEQGATLIVLTGGMSVDADDVTPEAIVQSGAAVVARGVPMQPGNMLMLAYLGETALIGIPASVMHHPVTSFDVFLPRVFAGIQITKEEIADYGVGGLCRFCPDCRFETCYFGNR